MKSSIASVVLAFATPLSAQTVVTATGMPATAAADPIRVAAARPVVERLWPLGTYRRMMDGTMSKMMDAMMTQMMGMRAADIAATAGEAGKKAAAEAGDQTLGDVTAKADPAFRERMKITMDTMMREMIPIMEKIEPVVRDNLTTIYARKYNAVELGDMARFFATPSGTSYASNAMLVFVEPEMIQGMTAFAPELMKAMPGIMKKVEAATAHLPPVPKKDASK
jgi:hypothetical protein